MTDHNEQRRERRVAFSGFVRLRGMGEEESVEAEIRNLSALGMFVASKRVPSPGAAVFCRVILGNDRRIIKGKVAWVEPGTAAAQLGAGIEFVDLSKKDSEVLRQVLEVGGEAEQSPPASPIPRPVSQVDSDNLGRVEVEFEGLPSPVKARARITDDGIVLTTKLPFLRVGSDVKVRFTTPEAPNVEAERQGRLQAVSLGSTGSDGVPRLLVELTTVVQEDDLLQLGAENAGPTPPVGLEIDTEPHVLTLPLPSMREQRRTDLRFAPDELTDPDITPVMHSWSAAPEPEPELASLAPDLGRAVSEVAVDGAEIQVDVASGPRPVADVEPAPITSLVKQVAWSTSSLALPVPQTSIEVNLTPMPELAERSIQPTPALILPPPPVSEPTLRVAGNHELSIPFSATLGREGQQGPWKILLGAAVALAAVALLVWGGDEPTAKRNEQASLPPPETPATSGIVIEALPAAPAPAPVAAKAAPLPAAPLPAVSSHWRPISDPSWPFTVAAESEQTTVFIPLAGNLAGQRIYKVTAPEGVGAIFPHATLPAGLGKFVVNDAGITQVWAQLRDNGLHVRVLFGRNVAAHTATLEPGGLRVVATRR